MPIRILLADDHAILRDGLASILRTESDFEIVGEADNGRDALRLAREHRPDVLIIDVSMPDMNGIDAATRVSALEDPPRILALSMHADARYVKGMLQAGARGYLHKSSAARELVEAVRALVGGRYFVSPSIGDFVVGEFVRQLGRESRPETAALTTREREVLQLIAEGHTSASIAERLHLSTKTVESHRARIMDKLGLRTVADLTKHAIREGLTSIEP